MRKLVVGVWLVLLVLLVACVGTPQPSVDGIWDGSRWDNTQWQ
jgi:hypothetical protein